ncbi:MAG TPA: FUSC family protein [Microbacterium sp.]|uniref:FUSC family protein n=1 Tax=Microbacterium sp. TaxID=51671 RepID=UPI002B5ED9FD|nr:FUSC family protein [Microbacterium sp.]HWI31531.1 FUSC family protein [Microbacterium sp.]
MSQAFGEGAYPATAAIPTGWRARVDPGGRLRRVRESGIAIVQIVVAAAGAYAFSLSVLGHPVPLLAATVTVSSLGLVRDARPRRVLETVLGMLLGILVSELLLLVTGSGWWQLAVALGLTLVFARFISPQASFAIAAAIQSLIVMIIPMTTGMPFTRLIDGIVGGVFALLVTALIPRSLRAVELRDARAVFRDTGSAAAALGQALRRGDRLRAERGLEKARALQPRVDAWRESLESGLAIARISPFLRRQRGELNRHARVLGGMDFATRNLRVVARRVVYLCDDGVARPVAADVLGEITRGAELIGRSLDDISLQPVARETLLAVAAHLDPRELLPGASLGDQNLIAAMRPLAVDLLVATGMPQADARAAVPRI